MEDRLISTTFSEWTANLGLTESVIRIFGNVRDIPYMVIPELIHPEKGPVGMLKLGKGSAIPDMNINACSKDITFLCFRKDYMQ